jgi:hypothetical protein
MNEKIPWRSVGEIKKGGCCEPPFVIREVLFHTPTYFKLLPASWREETNRGKRWAI